LCFIACVSDTGDELSQVLLLPAIIIAVSHPEPGLITGVNDTGDGNKGTGDYILPVSTTPSIINTKLQIYQRIFVKIQNSPKKIFRGQGETDS
jgi:hypothetical protein